jgi:hypothetical protein
MDLAVIRPTLVEAITDLDTLGNRLKAILADIDGAVASIQIPRQGRWTPEMLAALWPKVSHLDGVCALFEITAERPNETVTFTELVARSGLSDQQQRNEHARLSRVSADLFGQKTWPIENWQGNAPADGGKAETIYRMGSTVAAWWLKLTG